MTASAPITCTLDPPSLTARRELIDTLIRDGGLAHRRDDLCLYLDFRPEVRDAVERLVALERECCGFLAFELTTSQDVLSLTITAPETAREAAEAIFAGFLPQTPTAGCRCC